MSRTRLLGIGLALFTATCVLTLSVWNRSGHSSERRSIQPGTGGHERSGNTSPELVGTSDDAEPDRDVSASNSASVVQFPRRRDGLSEADRGHWEAILASALKTLTESNSFTVQDNVNLVLNTSIGAILRDAGQAHQLGDYRSLLDPVRDKETVVFTLNGEEFFVQRDQFPEFHVYRDHMIRYRKWELEPSASARPELDTQLLNDVFVRAQQAMTILKSEGSK
jgi:hypothetical protein